MSSPRTSSHTCWPTFCKGRQASAPRRTHNSWTGSGKGSLWASSGRAACIGHPVALLPSALGPGFRVRLPLSASPQPGLKEVV